MQLSHCMNQYELCLYNGKLQNVYFSDVSLEVTHGHSLIRYISKKVFESLEKLFR